MGKRSKAHPFGGNPFGAPSLRFDLKMPNYMKGAENFDTALGLSKRSGGFDIQPDDLGEFNRGFTKKPRARKKRNMSIERQQRILSGQEPLDQRELDNINNSRDIYGQPRTQ